MKRLFPAVALLAAALVTAAPALAEGPYSEGSKATGWGLLGEETARFEGTVIDALCVLTGDCPSDCGAGMRQMGILRSDDRIFLLATKNSQPAFTGATVDLAPYCGETVEADGLLVGDSAVTPGLGGARLYQVQTVRVAGQGEEQKADLWTGEWDKRNPGVPGKGPWFERDPRVLGEIEAHGRLGLGADEDRKFAEENF